MLDQKPPDCIVPDIELPVTPEREEEDEKKKSKHLHRHPSVAKTLKLEHE